MALFTMIHIYLANRQDIMSDATIVQHDDQRHPPCSSGSADHSTCGR